MKEKLKLLLQQNEDKKCLELSGSSEFKKHNSRKDKLNSINLHGEHFGGIDEAEKLEIETHGKRSKIRDQREYRSSSNSKSKESSVRDSQDKERNYVVKEHLEKEIGDRKSPYQSKGNEDGNTCTKVTSNGNSNCMVTAKKKGDSEETRAKVCHKSPPRISCDKNKSTTVKSHI